MLCDNCGANNPEGASVCGSCGAALTPEEETTPAQETQEVLREVQEVQESGKAPADKNKIAGLAIVIGGAVLAIALVVWIFSLLLGGGGPEGVAVDYIKAGMKANGGKTLVNLLPGAYIEEVLDMGDFDSKSELIREVNDALEDTHDMMEEYYGKYKVKVEVRKVKDWKNSEINDYNERMDDRKIDLEIKDGADVELKVTINGEDDKDTSKPTVKVIKVGGKWYLDPMSADLDY